jgi:hypothetical protein
MRSERRVEAKRDTGGGGGETFHRSAGDKREGGREAVVAWVGAGREGKREAQRPERNFLLACCCISCDRERSWRCSV